MEYVNKQTGEIYNVETVDLSNLCEGDLNFLFTCELSKLVAAMQLGDKGSINITVKVQRQADAAGDDTIFIDAAINTKYPKISLDDTNVKKVTDKGKVVQKAEKHNLFEQENATPENEEKQGD